MEASSNIVLTVEDIAKFLSIGKTKAYELVKTPGFPKIKIGRQIRVPSEAFHLWIKRQCNN